MPDSTLASSASLHLRLGAFGVLFSALAVVFTPPVAFLLAVSATIILSIL